MSRQNPWAKHFQAVWHERSGDRRLPYWLRVASLAYGSHAANGHARFRPGEIALVLGCVDPVTGEVRPLDKHNVQRSIAKAIEFGWLDKTSGSLCLVVPGHAVAGGLRGRADAQCPQHRKPRVSQKVTHLASIGESSEAHPVSHIMPTSNALTCGNADALLTLSEQPHPTDQPDQEATA